MINNPVNTGGNSPPALSEKTFTPRKFRGCSAKRSLVFRPFSTTLHDISTGTGARERPDERGKKAALAFIEFLAYNENRL
jgi:hypothetical protein